ncbi:MAG: histidine--tRNA ligase [Eubacteriales bacterium]|nr:histidine--tRNA ligase [Eubacteriales bacterium]
MAFVKKPVTGMRDILPDEMAVRNYVMQVIRETYTRYGFSSVMTPIVEHIENLTGKQGGDNEKLIFKILKRGEKLSEELSVLKEGLSAGPDAGSGEDAVSSLADSGLRYDLTLPLARYYANNQAKLPQPFKALQMGPVFRADRPQKGRFRQFVQCDIDILGDPTTLAEKELILATTEALSKFGFDGENCRIIINDRRLLFGLISYAGLPEEDAEKILIVLDKADKIGDEGVDAELLSLGYEEGCVKKLREALTGVANDAEGARRFGALLGAGAADAGESVADIMESVTAVKDRNICISFQPTLVRGMGYYTGTIFEIQAEGFGSSVGGGGRYDRMIGKFTGQDVPAVGFSIGFERIMTLLMETGFRVPGAAVKTAFLIEKGMPSARLGEIFDEAIRRRADGGQVLLVWMAKNKKFQKENLQKEGYTEFCDFYREALKN